MKQMIDVKQISIIGLGLMGGSIALALKNRGIKGKIVGYDICRNYVDEALGSKAIDMGADNPEEAVIGAGLVIIAVPISQYKTIFNEINPFLALGCIVTDVGSVKLEPVELAEKLLPKGIHFVGGHPMTGSERGGFNAADPFLYENAYYFLTPREDTPAEAVGTMEDLIKSLGAYAVPIAPKEHDLIVSRMSHLPHIIASTLVNFMDNDKGISYLTFVGGGFRDTTRIASGNPHMW
ncbi:MAG: prephenate dehydrogenase/arogenate dehydrogenase family protein, partial [Clostridiales bacterium]|nr:prephenate dehydrogenase/arogenate dehydrogenase family protein [Clostridiales bacterium]